MKKIFVLLATITFFCFSCATSKRISSDASSIEKGRELFALLSSGKGDSLYQLMTPQFQSAVNGREGFEKLMQQLPAQLGKELSIEKEASFDEAGLTSYYRISRFEKNPSITTRFVWDDNQLHGLTVRPTTKPAQSDYLDYKTKTTLALPFKSTWYVAWGGREHYLNRHVAAPDQRFAYDFIYAEEGKVSKESPKTNEDYFGFGKPIYSPAAGTIIVAVDSVEDNRLGVVNSTSPPGNYVVIDHGSGEYSLLAHFKKGTVAVKKGNVVKAGDLLGLCGNSGQSTLPHLHYHLQTGKDYQQGVGLPAFFHGYKSNGEKVQTGEPARGQYISPIK